MIAYLKGKIINIGVETAIIEVQGVGYEAYLSGSAFRKIAIGAEAELYTHLQVKEDGITLFGFSTPQEKELFLKLITVSGVGPKAAMAILSLLTPDRLSMAISSEDTKAIAKASGIGPKTAARVVLELKDKIVKLPFGSSDGGDFAPSAPMPKGSNLSEALEALIVLGYSRSDAQRALGGIDPKLDVSKIIPLALAKLMR